MTATTDETLTIIPAWSEDNSSDTPDALKAFLDTKPINRSAYISAEGYSFDLEVHHWGDRFTIKARMGEDAWNIYSSHKFDFSDQERSTDGWYRGDDVRMTPQHYEAVTKLIGNIGIEGPTIPTELSGWVSQYRSEPRHLNFGFEDKGNRHYLGLDLARHGDPDKVDRLIRDHRFDELVALSTGEANAHLNYPHHADLTSFSPQQIEADILAETAALAPEYELEPHQMQNILKDMSASVLNSRGYKPDYGYQIAAGNLVEPQTNDFRAHVTCRGKWALEFNWEGDYHSIPLGGVPGDTFQSDEDRAAVVTDYGSLGAIEKMIQDSRFRELVTASVSAPAYYHHYPELNDMQGVYPEVAKERIESRLLLVATEYGLAERGIQLLEDMRLKVMEDRGEHQNHSYDGLLGIVRVPRDELQQALPEVDRNEVIADPPPTVEEAYVEHLMALAECDMEMSPEEYSEWQEELAKASDTGIYSPDDIAASEENSGTQVESQVEPAIALPDTPPIKEAGSAEDQSPECIQEDLENHLTVEMIDVTQGTLTQQLRVTIRDVVVDIKVGYETITGEFITLDDVESSVIEAVAKDPRFTELLAISSGMIDYPYVQYPDFSYVNRLDTGDELKQFIDSRVYKLGDEYGIPSVTEKLIETINIRHASEAEVYQFRIRNNAVKGIPFKPSKFQGGKIDQSGRLPESYVSIGEVYIDDRIKNLELPIRIGSEEFTLTVGVETQNGTSYRYGDSIEPIQGIAQDQRFKELVAATAGIQEYPYTHNLDFRHPEKLTAEELQTAINRRAEILGEEYGVRIMGESLVAHVATIYAVLRGTTREVLLQSFVDPTQEIPQANQQPNIDLYQSLYGAADQYGDFDVGFTELTLGNGYSVTTTDQSLNIFKDNERIIRVVADNPGPYDGVLQEPFHIEDRSTPEQGLELLVELHNLELWAEVDFEKPHQETPIAEGAIAAEQSENITQQIQELDDTQGTATPSVPASQPAQNLIWITHEASYIKSRTTCITTTRSIAQVLNDCYYILCEGYEIFDDHCEGRISDHISDCEPLPESVCHLLVKYFGYEISQWAYDATEIDLLYIWQGPRIPEIRRTDKTSELWRNLTRFRFGFYPELFAIMKGEIDPHNMPQYPWIGKYSCITGWVSGDYILELPFGCFNTEEEALQFGRLCHAIKPCSEPSTVMWLHYWVDYELDRTCFQISDLTVYKKPDGFVEGGCRGYEDLEPADIPAQEIPIEGIETPAYMYSLAR